jgi:hypothetical protein
MVVKAVRSIIVGPRQRSLTSNLLSDPRELGLLLDEHREQTVIVSSALYNRAVQGFGFLTFILNDLIISEGSFKIVLISFQFLSNLFVIIMIRHSVSGDRWGNATTSGATWRRSYGYFVEA